MSLSVISNYAANVAHRYLQANNDMASNSIAKLSAGTRVLTAKDDAASLAIGSRLAAEIAGEQQAQVNATQATSLLQIADGALSKVNDILVRLKTLSVQAGSGQLSSTERGALNTEYQSLLSEIDRIAQATTFNGVSLVNGQSTTSVSLNSQGNTNDVVQAADGIQSIALDNSVGSAAIKVAYDSSSHVLTLTNLTTGVSQGVSIGSTAIATNATQTVNFSTVGATITLNSAFDKTANIAPTNSFTLGTSGTGALSSISITSATVSTGLINLATNGGTINTATASASTITIGGFSAGSVDLTATGTHSVTLSNGSGASFTLNFNVTTAFGSSTNNSTISVGDLGALVFGQTATSNSTSFSFKLGTGTTAGVDDVTVSVAAASTSALSLTGTSVDGSDATNANTASTAISAAITTLNTARAGIGASQNRLQFASDNLSTSLQNNESARSSLMDLDVASEMTKFTSAQVLQQIGVSTLAQANQMPQQLMKLFQ
jgi:flagellin